jgi:hypothetical protein
VPIFPDTPDGCAAQVDYYEPSRLNNLPNSQLDDNDAMRGLEPPAERRAREQRDNPLPNRPTAIKMSPFRQITTSGARLLASIRSLLDCARARDASLCAASFRFRGRDGLQWQC